MTRLTAYALACGQVETHKAKNGETVTLWHEHGIYHTRRSDWRGRDSLWITATTLSQARKNVALLKNGLFHSGV